MQYRRYLGLVECYKKWDSNLESVVVCDTSEISCAGSMQQNFGAVKRTKIGWALFLSNLG